MSLKKNNIMLTPQQTLELKNRHLEKIIEQKGLYLDEEVKAEMNYWRDILMREIEENESLRSNRIKTRQQIE